MSNSDVVDNRRNNKSSHKPGGISGIRRNRPSYSCEGCRSRRVKCDLVHPQCGSCTRNGMTCVYPNLTVKRVSLSDSNRRPSYNKSSRKQSGSSTHQLDTPPSPASESASEGTCSFWASLGEVSHDVNALLGDSFSSLVRNTNPFVDVRAQASDPQNHPFLNIYDNMINALVHDKMHLADLLRRLPAKSSCDHLYEVFVCCVHPITPYFHLPTFDERYCRFWRWYDHWDQQSSPQGVLLEIPSFLALLFAVLYYGSVIDPLVTGDEWTGVPGHDSALFLALGTRALGMVDFPHKTTLYSLIAFMLLQMDQLRCQYTSACSFVAVAVRIAQSMGLHKEEMNAGVHPVYAEERRRVWCLLMHIDMITARRAGLAPIVINPRREYLPLISETDDQYIGAKPKNKAMRTSIAYVLAKGRYEASLCVKPILTRQVDHDAATVAEIRGFRHSVDQLADDLEERVTRICKMGRTHLAAENPAPMSLYTRNGLRGSPEAYLQWAQATLRYTIEQSYCEVYNLALTDVAVWYSIRDDAIGHYQAFVRHYIDLCTTHSYQPHQWIYPGYHQPIQAVAVLLVDLYREPNSKQAYETRALIEQLFLIYQLNCDESSRSSKRALGASTTHKPFGAAWSKLEILRRRVWQGLGFDTPDAWPEFTHNSIDEIMAPVPQGYDGSEPMLKMEDNTQLWDEQHCAQPWQWMRNVQTIQLTAVLDNSVQFQPPYLGPNTCTFEPFPRSIQDPSSMAQMRASAQSTASEMLNTDYSWMLDYDGEPSVSSASGM